MEKSFRFLLLFSILIGSLILGPVMPAYAFTFSAEINKKFTPIVIASGQTSRLDITIFNSNSFPLDNASFTDNLIGRQTGLKIASPVNLGNTCGGVVTAGAGTTTISLSGGTVPSEVGSNPGSCTISVDITSTTPGNLINTIPAYGIPDYPGVGLHATANGGADEITNTTPASATLQVNSVMSPSLTKNFTPNTVWVGQSSQLEINLSNNDLLTALTEATYTDYLPSPFVVAAPLTTGMEGCGAATLTAAAGATSITLNNATIAPASNCRLSVRVVSSTQGQYTNTIPAGPGGLGSVQTLQGVTNLSPATANINVQEVGITKNFNPVTIQQGDTSLLTVTLRNPTGANYTGIGLVDTLPSGLTISGTPVSPQCGGLITFNPNSITLSGGTIPAGDVTTPGFCTIVAQVTGATVGTHTNIIPAHAMTGPVTNLLEATADLDVQSHAIGVEKAFGGNFIQGGSTSLTITLQNAASTALTGVHFTDTMPANITVVGTPTASVSCGGSASVTSTANSITLTNANIPSGTALVPGTCVVTAVVTSSVSGTFTNTIPAGDVQSNQGIGNTSSNNANVTVYGIGNPATVTKAFQTSPILAGTPTRLRITITAPDDTALSGISISDTLPDDMVIVGTPDAIANPTTTCGGTLTAGIATKLIHLAGGTIPSVGGSCTITAYVTSNTLGTHTNIIPGSTLVTSEGRTDPTDSQASVDVTNLSTSKLFTPDTVSPNGISRFTITLQNTNLIALTNVYVGDYLSSMGGDGVANGVFVAPTPNASTTCGSGSITAAAGTQIITMTGGSVPASDGVVPGLCTIGVDVQGRGDAGTRTNSLETGNVEGTLAGTSTTMVPVANAFASLTISDLAIQVNKGFNPPSVFGGSSSLMSVQLTNLRPSALSQIKFTDTMPANMILANPVDLNVGDCGGTLTGTPGTNAFSFSGGSLTPSGTCTMTLRVTMTVIGNLTNTIHAGDVTTFEGASNPQDASASLTNLSGASISKSFAPNPIPVGAYSLLTLTINNTSNVVLTGMGLNDALPGSLPSGLSIAASPAPINNCGGSLTADAGTQNIQLTNGTLANNSSCTMIIPVTSTVPNSYLNTIPAHNLDESTHSTTNNQPASDTLVVTGFSLGNRVWNDNGAGGGSANNGIRDGTEPGISGAAVNLYRDSNNDGTPDGASIATTTTDSNGYYRFDNLLADNYIVEVIPPSGYAAVTTNGGDPDNNIDNDNNGVVIGSGSIRSNPVTLGPGGSEPLFAQEADPGTTQLPGEAFDSYSNRTVDFGLTTATYSLGNRVWDDNGAGGGTANDGIRNGTEPGLTGVTVNLYRDSNNDGTPDGASIATTTTDGSGYYRFDNLSPDTYIVEAGIPSGYISSAVNGGDPDNNIDNDNNGVIVVGSFIRSNPVTLGPGASEPTTDNDPLTNPLPGEAPNAFSNRTVDFGFVQSTYSLGNRVWADNGAGGGTANNGLLDGTEPGLANVTVRLYRDTNNDGTPDGAAIASVLTDANGYYRFDDLTADNYIVEVAVPTGYVTSAVNGGDADNNIDSDNNGVVIVGSNIRSNPVTLGPGGSEPTFVQEPDPGITQLPGEAADTYSNRTVDFGFVPTTSIGDFVWNDLNLNGIQDAGEPGITGVAVNLYTSTGTLVASTTTSSSGLYSFTGLTPGGYYLVFAPPSGYTFSPQDQGANDAVDSDANTTTGQTATTTLTAGENDLTWDAGLYQLASLGDFVWLDTNGNGIQDAGEAGISGVQVDLYTSAGVFVTTTTTSGSGAYLFNNLIPGGYYVKFTPPAGYAITLKDQGGNDATDSDADQTSGQTDVTTLTSGENDMTWDAGLYQPASLGDFVWVDTNGNGIQDAGEAGVNGVTVRLFNSANTLVATTTTAQVTGVDGIYHFNNLIPGNYYVQFTPPSGYGFTQMDAGADDSKDSDANQATGQTIQTSLVSNETDLTWDAGLVSTASLGDFVWNDLNANGIQDAGEPGISGVTVNLLNSTGTTVLATTVTDASGLYSFTNLNPGSYRVGFVTPAGYIISPYQLGSDITKDSNANITTGQTVPITLTAGQSDMTWDAGLYQLASIGDFVWNDLNSNGIQDAGEPGIGTVTVNLLNGSGAIVGTTATSASGLYSFTNLKPGDYSVRFTLPSGYIFTLKDAGLNDAVDSDADQSTGQTAITSLVSGENDLTWDAGLVLPGPMIGIAKQVVGKPVKVSAGTWDVTYQLLVQNYGIVPLSNIQVTDDLSSTFPAGTTFTVRSVSSSYFAVNWPGYTGITGLPDSQRNLLKGTDSLAQNQKEIITLVVRVVPANTGPFNNSAIATGQPPTGNPVTDISQNGPNPDSDNDHNPTNNNEPTPVSFGPNLYDPPFGVKILDINRRPIFHWTLEWINDTNIIAINTAVSDGISAGTTFLDDGIPSGSPLPAGTLPLGTVASGVVCTPHSVQTTTTYCYYEGPTATYPRGRIVWQGVLGPDLGITDPKKAVNDIKIEFNVHLDNGVTQVENIATIDADLNGNGLTTDPGEQRVATASASWNAGSLGSGGGGGAAGAAAVSEIPVTGFAPGMVTNLPMMPKNAYDIYTGLTIEIPTLGINTKLVGIPVSGTTWDLTWLGNQLGYLNGTAFPTLAGNSVITGHVYGADGLPGPFVNLAKLKWGDKIFINAFGQRYTYEVRTAFVTTPNDTSILKHETLPWITLLTCKDYNEKSNTYQSRVVIRAVQVKVNPQ